jgi:glycosyltransferase involved in cell wall biosynthesis
VIRVVAYGVNEGAEIALGGQLWLTRVAEQLTCYKGFEVVKMPSPPEVGKNRVKNLVNAYIQGFKVLKMKPDVILLCAGKDENAALSLLHIFLSRGSKIYLPIFHYEPMRIGKHNWIGNFLAKVLLCITYKLNEKLWKEAPALFVLSESAKKEIAEKLRIPKDKLILTGCGVEMHENSKKIQKDIDFLCIGRIGKFFHLADIWKEIRKIKPEVNFHMAGIGRDNPIVNELEKIGNFRHHGVVSEEEKATLYNRSKVFIFPSLYEGFGIAVAEALSYGLPVVAWDLPVYKEIWGKSYAFRKVRLGDCAGFAKEAVFTLENFEELAKEANFISKKLKTDWKDVGRIVKEIIATHNCLHNL